MTARHQTCHHGMYRLTCADYDELWDYAHGVCQICGIQPEDTPIGKLVIDHAPEYGFYAVRGLLCSKCNSLMRYVDAGQKKDLRALRYCANAWFVRVLHGRHGTNVATAKVRRQLNAQLPTPATRKETPDV